jgi:hypothetical protein
MCLTCCLTCGFAQTQHKAPCTLPLLRLAVCCLLLQIFTSVGPVQELVVLRDRATQESKGSAFVWYRTGADADKVRRGPQHGTA